MITKDRILEELQRFPEQFSLEEFIERLIFLEKLEERIEESNSEDVLDEEIVNKEIEGWFK
ncbi:MAG: hypothetical protein WAR77_14250 [Saprospiraceae bacterium]|nr:hypothetical protein [Saprospiraceae bacterium]